MGDKKTNLTNERRHFWYRQHTTMRSHENFGVNVMEITSDMVVLYHTFSVHILRPSFATLAMQNECNCACNIAHL